MDLNIEDPSSSEKQSVVKATVLREHGGSKSSSKQAVQCGSVFYFCELFMWYSVFQQKKFIYILKTLGSVLFKEKCITFL